MLELLAKNHKIWLRMVKGFGADYDTAQDIVQSFYLRMHKYVKDEERIMYNDEEVNRFFLLRYPEEYVHHLYKCSQ
jgi:hypothetical protein